MTRWTFLTTLFVALAMATACGGAVEPDDGTDDAGTADAGAPDAGTPDAGTPDAGTPDGGSGTATDCSRFTDTCTTTPPGSIQFDCKKRFAYGVNYAWSGVSGTDNQHFGTDFGGYATWSQKGVSQDRDRYKTDMQAMKDNGVDVIRWWMFPNLDNTDAFTWDSNNYPTGLGGTLLADIEAALEIAKEVGVHLQLTIFSFDTLSNICYHSSVGKKEACYRTLSTYMADTSKRAAMMEKIIKPIAKAVEASPNRDRMHSWDVVNEPEWSIGTRVETKDANGNVTATNQQESDGYGDEKFEAARSDITPAPFKQYEAFVREVVTTLHAHSTAPVTVGGAAIKWAKAWSNVGLDFYNFHWYGWVDDWFPYDRPLSQYGVTDKPVMMGEFPLGGLHRSTQSNPEYAAAYPGDWGNPTTQNRPMVDYQTMLAKIWELGYAGAAGWAFNGADPNTSPSGKYDFSWANNKGSVKAFADQKGCMVRY